MNKEKFISEIEKLNIKYTDDMLNKLDVYCDFLLEYNTHTNLTSITNKEDVYLKHFYDSLSIVNAINLNNINSLIDIGTGAGFPGLVIKIFFPNIKVTLLDSNNKKTKFLTEIINKLELENIQVINDRVEQYSKNHLNEYDIVTSRAVAFMDIIIELGLPLIKKEGKLVLLKGNLDNEKNILDNHKKDLNIKDYKIINLDIDGLTERNLVIIDKNKDTISPKNFNQILKQNKKWSN